MECGLENEQDSDLESHSNDPSDALPIQVKGPLRQSYGKEIERFLEGRPLARLLKPKLSMSFYCFQNDDAKTVIALYKVVSSSQTRSSIRRSHENPVSLPRRGLLSNRIFFEESKFVMKTEVGDEKKE